MQALVGSTTGPCSPQEPVLAPDQHVKDALKWNSVPECPITPSAQAPADSRISSSMASGLARKRTLLRNEQGRQPQAMEQNPTFSAQFPAGNSRRRRRGTLLSPTEEEQPASHGKFSTSQGWGTSLSLAFTPAV